MQRALTIATVALAIPFLFVCGAHVQGKDVAPDGATWCFAARGKTPDGPQVGLACFETRRTCQRARMKALKYGKWGGLLEISECGEGMR